MSPGLGGVWNAVTCQREKGEETGDRHREGGRVALGREVGVWSTRPGPKDCQPLKMLGRGLGQSPPQTPSGNQCCWHVD